MVTLTCEIVNCYSHRHCVRQLILGNHRNSRPSSHVLIRTSNKTHRIRLDWIYTSVYISMNIYIWYSYHFTRKFMILLIFGLISVTISFPEVSYIKGPPLNTKHKPFGNDGKENGIRQISKQECSITVKKWFQSNKIASGSSDIENLEMLMSLDKVAQVMPGLKPQRVELVSFGMFHDGNIHCIASVLWQKLTLPNEMKILCIYEEKGIEDNNIEEMLRFIQDICKDNAIIPDFSILDKFIIFQPILSKVLKKSVPDEISIRNEKLKEQYIQLNKVGICLDIVTSLHTRKDYLLLDLGHYWYRYKLTFENIDIPFYFRQKKGRYAEYEVIFSRPEAGTVFGSGTVGGPRIIKIDELTKRDEILNESNLKIKELAEDIRSKIIDPPHSS